MRPDEDEEQLPAKDAEPVFPAPFGYKFGNSSVDLSSKLINDTMLDEYNNMVELTKRTKREKTGSSLIRKYLVCLLMKYDVLTNVKINLDANNPSIKRLDNTFQGLSAPGLGTS